MWEAEPQPSSMLAATPTRAPPPEPGAAGRPPPLRPPHSRPPDISTRARSPLWPMNNAGRVPAPAAPRPDLPDPPASRGPGEKLGDLGGGAALDRDTLPAPSPRGPG